MPLMAAGVAFWLFLALFPTIIAVITVYGLVTDPRQAASEVQEIVAALPEIARSTVTGEVESIASTRSETLTVGLVGSLLAALWAASTGTMYLIKATNNAYGEDEQRGFLKLRAIALLTTLVLVMFVAVSIAALTVLPWLLEGLGLGMVATVATQLLRWLGLVLLFAMGLALLYRYAPNRNNAQFRWISVGAVTATGLWVLGSGAFSFYVSNLGNYNRTYGAVGGVIVLLLWLYLTSLVVLVGAEINAEAEHQTTHDTTTGEERPMGERGAYVADTYPEDKRSMG
jgi:membrane protein